MSSEQTRSAIHAAFASDDWARVREILSENSDLKTRINDPLGDFGAPAITCVRSKAMLDVLLAAGADINAKSNWWAGGFGLLHGASPELATYAISRGAVVDVHAAARLGLLDQLKRLVSGDPELVHARGGDGQTPLHFASTVPIAEYLLERGAQLDVRDIDHESTPAQWMIGGRQDVVRFLIGRGCQTDLLMAAALGDRTLVEKHLALDPQSAWLRVSDEHFPMIGGKNGGTIYQWELGWYVSAHQVAKSRGHAELYRFLLDQSPDELKLLTAAWLGEQTTVKSLVQSRPGLGARLSAIESRHLAHAARNDDLPAFRLMLAIGMPVDATSQHAGTPLHWAAFHGNAEMIELLLPEHPPLEVRDRDFQATPLEWALYGSEHGWKCRTGNYAAATEALLRAGAKRPAEPRGSPAVREVLQRG